MNPYSNQLTAYLMRQRLDKALIVTETSWIQILSFYSSCQLYSWKSFTCQILVWHFQQGTKFKKFDNKSMYNKICMQSIFTYIFYIFIINSFYIPDGARAKQLVIYNDVCVFLFVSDAIIFSRWKSTYYLLKKFI